jgi:hypothetical protein
MALPDEVQNYVMANGQTASANILSLLTKLNELHLIHGLQTASPLTVTTTSRTAGVVQQSMNDTGQQVTVNRS